MIIFLKIRCSFANAHITLLWKEQKKKCNNLTVYNKWITIKTYSLDVFCITLDGRFSKSVLIFFLGTKIRSLKCFHFVNCKIGLQKIFVYWCLWSGVLMTIVLMPKIVFNTLGIMSKKWTGAPQSLGMKERTEGNGACRVRVPWEPRRVLGWLGNVKGFLELFSLC